MKRRHLIYCLLCVFCLYSCIYDLIVDTGYVAVKGTQQGMNAVSYFAAVNASLKDINSAFIKAGSKVNLDDTYKIVYGKSLKEAGVSGDTGYKFISMKDGTHHFQELLKEKQLPGAQNYIITSIDTAIPKGYILVAAVYRPRETIRVVDKHDRATFKLFTKDDLGFYEPYMLDADGNALDTIVDWAGVPMKIFSQQKNRAVMLTLAANKVFENATRIDYWEAEQRWIAGQYGSVCEEQDQKTCNIMGLKRGFIQ